MIFLSFCWAEVDTESRGQDYWGMTSIYLVIM